MTNERRYDWTRRNGESWPSKWKGKEVHTRWLWVRSWWKRWSVFHYSFRREKYSSTWITARNFQVTSLIWSYLPNIQAFTHSESIGKKRSRSPQCYFYYQSQPICKEMFLHFYGLSDSRFRQLKEHYQNHGIFPRTHGNTKRLPENTLPQATTEGVHTFLLNYVEENAIALPGRIPGFKSDDIKVLSSSETKMERLACICYSVRNLRYASR